jgi:hypothetical protein
MVLVVFLVVFIGTMLCLFMLMMVVMIMPFVRFFSSLVMVVL